MSDVKSFDEWITTARVLELHAEGMKRYSGTVPPKDHGKECIEGILGNAFNASIFNESEDAHPGLIFMCYTLMYIAKDHCFSDGNKRAAWLVAIEICQKIAQLTLDASDGEAEQFVLDIIEKRLEIGEVANWIATRLVGIH